MKRLGRRRYLISFRTKDLPQIFTDTLILGGGIAGMRAALEAEKAGQVIVLSKGPWEECNTYYAQGGVAAVIRPPDKIADHIADTLKNAGGLADAKIVRQICRQGPTRIRELIQWGIRFDKKGRQLSLTCEGGHGAARILHADGDATGRVIFQFLADRLRKYPKIRIIENSFAVDLLTADDVCLGALVNLPEKGLHAIWAKTVILATGGVGQLYRETTNPDSATADGLAMAFRAGAKLRDLEMIQFHPTTLYVAGATRALISETVRGEGAHLVNRRGRRFMAEYDPRAELASRDIVSRAILREMVRTESTCVWLDARHFGAVRFKKRFPTIHTAIKDVGLNPAKDLIPVRPAAHYLVGGVLVDRRAHTSIQRLFACGEVASTGLHGANRLGSNSLLERLVYGQIAGLSAARAVRAARGPESGTPIESKPKISGRTVLDIRDVQNSLRSVMGRSVGIERTGERLEEVLDMIAFWSRYVLDKVFDNPLGWECQNMLQVGRLIAAAALTRTESRGAHYRTDHPNPEKGKPKHTLFHVSTVPNMKGVG